MRSQTHLYWNSRTGYLPRSLASVTMIAVAAVGLGVPVASAGAPSITVPYFDSGQHAISIDGSGVDWPEEALSGGINFYPGDGNAGSATEHGTTVLGTMTNRADGEVLLHLAHDGQFIYVLATIQDDVLEQRTSESNTNDAWREDALHLYVDSTNARASSIATPPISYQEGYEQFGVSTDLNCYTENCDFTTNNTGGAAGPGAEPDQVNWLVAVGVSGSGPFTYVFEERFPMTEVSGHNLRTMVPGNSYGFNAEFVDSEAGSYPQGWFFWSSDGARDAWNAEDLWGTMFLEPVTATSGSISITPTFVLFPDRAIGEGPTASTTVSLVNVGDGDLCIYGVGLSGADKAHFVITEDSGQVSLSPGDERLVQVAFDPFSVGDKTGALAIVSDDPEHGTAGVYLWGHGYQDVDIDVSPVDLIWYNQSIPDAPALPGAVTISNVGGGSLSVGVALSGTHADQFLITGDTGQTALAAAESRVIEVAFNPSSAGLKTGSLHITSNDSDEPTVDVALSGTGFDPELGYASPVWVDSSYGGLERGTEDQPYNTLAEACDLVLPGGVVEIQRGPCDESIRIAKPMRIVVTDDAVLVGASGSSSSL